MTNERGPAERGTTATRPRDIPKRGWGDVLKRVAAAIGNDNVPLIAAGVAFYAILAIFPALVALVSTYGLIADPRQVERQLQALSGMMPEAAWQIIEQQLTSVASSAQGSLTLGVAAGILIALWSATRGTKSAMAAMNIAYNESERRGFLRLNLVAVLLTAGLLLIMMLALLAVLAVPPLLGVLELGPWLAWLVSVARWAVLAGVIMLALALLYHYGPSWRAPRWAWVSPGAVFATIVWIVASVLFSWYVASFANYNATYGSLGAVIILLTWFFLSAFVLVLGAEINGELEHQTGEDTTVGEERPRGERGAYMADHMASGPSPS